MRFNLKEGLFRNILWILCLFFIISNFYIGITKYVWLDEIATIIEINSLSPWKLLLKFYEGIDTHPPLYFLLIAVIKSIFNFNSEVILRSISFIFSLTSLGIIYLIFKELGQKSSFIIFLSLFSITNYLVQYVSFEIRPYSLFLLLFSTFMLLCLKYSKDKKQGYLLLIVGTLLLYTHYFMMYYLLFIILILVLYSLKNKKYNKLITILLLSALLFVPWIPAIKNQFNYFNKTIHQRIPQVEELFLVYLEYFRYLVIPFLVLLLYYFIKIYRNRNIYDKKQNEFITYLSVIALVPIPIYVLSLFRYSVFYDRYLIPSALAVLILVTLAVSLLEFQNKKWFQIVFVGVIVLLGSHRINQSLINIERNQNLVDKYILFSNKLPLICETPHSFTQLYYYTGFSDSSNVFLINDSLVAMCSKPQNYALFDFYWWRSWSKLFRIKNIYTWEEFNKKNINEYYLLNVDRISLFEKKIEGNNKYNYVYELDSLYYIKQKP